MWSSMPNLSTVGPTVWLPIKNRHTHSHLYFIDCLAKHQGFTIGGRDSNLGSATQSVEGKNKTIYVNKVSIRAGVAQRSCSRF